MPKTREEFWKKKFDANIIRDKGNIEKLIDMGWRVAVVWECAIKKKDIVLFDEVVTKLENWILREYHDYLELPVRS